MARLRAVWVGLAVCGFTRAALADGDPEATPTTREKAASPTVTVEPQQREKAPQPSSNTDDVFGGGYSRDQQRWRETHGLTIQRKPFREDRHWYGWEIFVSDAAFGALVGVGAALGSRRASADGSVLVLPGTVGYLLGGPMIHAAHNRPAMGGASLGMRLPVALLGAGLALGLQNCKPGNDGEFCLGPNIVPAFFAGLAITSALDAGLLGWDAAKPKPSAGASCDITPTLSADGKSGGLLAYGRF